MSPSTSGQKFSSEISAGLAELLFAAAMEVAEAIVVKAEKVERGDVEILDRLDRFYEQRGGVIREFSRSLRFGRTRRNGPAYLRRGQQQRPGR